MISVDSVKSSSDGVIKLMSPSAKSISQDLFLLFKILTLATQATNALNWVQQFSWDNSGDKFLDALVEGLSNNNDKNLLEYTSPRFLIIVRSIMISLCTRRQL